jgi:serine/threonine-protein phosphatase 2A regulatory subunit A
MQHIPLLAKQLGKVFFTERLVALCIGWLGDDISSIRQAATENLKELTGIFGSEWAAEFLLTGLGDVRRHRSYLRRLAAVNAFTLMGTVMEPAYTRTEILPLILLMATDNVSLYRMLKPTFPVPGSHSVLCLLGCKY